MLRLLLATLLCPFLTGCFTSATSQKAFSNKVDWFEPTAIYNSHSGGDVAIEGGCYKWSAGQKTLVYAPAYLIIPAKVLVAAHSKSGGDISFSQIATLPADVRNNLRLQKSLPAGFEKMADVSKDQSGIQVNKQTQVNLADLAKLPFALVIDAATLPLQGILLYEARGLRDVN
ncbi:MAG: hypothetical protein ACLQHM_13570 [Limisphaerales bacterium]